MAVERISSKNLAKAVDKAVKLAARKHSLQLHPNHFDRDVFLTPWWLVGRVIRDSVDLNQAFEAAEAITAGVKLPGADFQAVAMRIDRDILVGFIERFGKQIDIPMAPGVIGPMY